MTNLLRLTFNELLEASREYVRLRQEYKDIGSERTKIAMRIKLFEKLIALENNVYSPCPKTREVAQ